VDSRQDLDQEKTACREGRVLKPDGWQQVKDLFEQARCIPPDGRAELLAQAADPEIREEVESLLAAYDASPGFLETPAARPSQGPGTASLAGCRVSSWRLLREIGRGGMGVVWEAERADGEYRQRVAVKLLSGAFLSPARVARFREERRILARLEHPSIARLLDGGTASDGSPYLAMEYVEGQALDSWCESRKPPLRERLKLFLEICAAVDYAHRCLVIHRDLKPANILVTADGSPKLLDFGIARLLDPEEDGEPRSTQPTERILTPGFASPEQVRGEPASTASDIYSLGVVLYLMLTGRRPYPEDPGDPLGVLRAVLEQDPAPPSAAAGAAGRPLRGELDAVVLCALSKNPDERYASVRAFADDVRAWLDGRPVRAHPDSQWRRAVKFVRRNKTPSLAVALALVSLLGGTVVSLWQAHVARRERSRAESSFRDVRQFSRSVLFELDNAIRNLPGSTPVRLLLLRRATEMLDNLAGKARDDAALQLELAEGYRRVGHIQGSSFSANLGQEDAAIRSFYRAVQLGESACAAMPANSEAAGLLLAAYEDLGDALLLKDPVQADAVYRQHRELLARIERLPRLDIPAEYSVATGYSAQGYYQTQRNRLAVAKQSYLMAVSRFASLAPRGAKLRDLGSQYAFALKRLGAILITEQSLGEAERSYRRALEIENAELAAKPGDKRLVIDRTLTLSDLALILKKRKNLAGAAAIYEDVVRVRRAALEADPTDRRLVDLTVSAELMLASVCSAARRHGEAIEIARTALRLREQTHIRTAENERSLAAARVSFARFALDGAADGSPRLQRAWEAEAREAVRLAAPVVERMGTENLTLGSSALRDDYLEVRQRLRKLSGVERGP
jgi:serine/threonine protein kinase